jgi:hypothetical protein
VDVTLFIPSAVINPNNLRQQGRRRVADGREMKAFVAAHEAI